MANTADYTYFTRPRLLAKMGEGISNLKGAKFFEPADVGNFSNPLTRVQVPPCNRMLFYTYDLYVQWCGFDGLQGEAIAKHVAAAAEALELRRGRGPPLLTQRPRLLIENFPDIFIVPLFTANVWPELVEALIAANREMLLVHRGNPSAGPHQVAMLIRKFWSRMASRTL